MPIRAAARPFVPGVVVAVWLAASLVSCGDGEGGSAAPASIGVDEVLEEERTFIDASRPTRANGSAPASDQRTLATRLWYAPMPVAAPACAGRRCALVLLAHGWGGRTSRFDAIARALASHGYIVAAPSFPLTNEDAPGGHLNGLTDASEQPRDLSFIVDELLAAAADRQDPLYQRIDAERIGAVGHSLGGATVIGATHAVCCIDPRFDAAVLVAPATFLVSGSFGPTTGYGPPMLTVNGHDDPLVSPSSSRAYARSLAPPTYYLEVADVGHVFLIENVGEPLPPLHVTARAAQAFLDEYLGGLKGATAAALEELVAEGHDAEVSE
jgi:dienelactone hydrolase